MPVVKYAAKRSLTAGTTEDDEITLDLDLRDDMARSRQAVRSTNTAISGKRESVYDRADESWSCRTRLLSQSSRDDMVMFLDSVEDGQTFEFAPYDESTDSPIDYRNVQLASDGYEETREVSTGTPENDEFSFAFSLIEVP